MQKQAIDAVNDFTRTKMREDGFYRRIMPPLTITNDELDRQVDTDQPGEGCRQGTRFPGGCVASVRDAPDQLLHPWTALPRHV
jgi:hypothetical protein